MFLAKAVHTSPDRRVADLMAADRSKTARCPTSLCGVWEQDFAKCESLCPLLSGLGMPKALQYVACPIADRTSTVLRISCPEDGILEIVDKTAFGRNATRVQTDGSESERLTRGRKKPFMLSATATKERAVLDCRLVSRGAGWHTRQERYLSPADVDANGAPLLVERHVLVRPDAEDVVVTRHFRRCTDERGDEDLRPSGA